MKSLVKRVLPLTVAFLVGTGMVGTAWAIKTFVFKGNLKVTGVVTAKDFHYSVPKVAMLNVPGSAFTVDDASSDSVDHSNYSGAVDLNTQFSDAVAPVNLPQGAIVTKVVVWYAPASSGGWEMHLESNFDTAAAQDHDDMSILDAATCVANPCTVADTSIFPNKINNNTRFYGLWLNNQNGPGVTIYRAQIFYTTAAVGPASSWASTGRVNAPGVDHNS